MSAGNPTGVLMGQDSHNLQMQQFKKYYEDKIKELEDKFNKINQSRSGITDFEKKRKLNTNIMTPWDERKAKIKMNFQKYDKCVSDYKEALQVIEGLHAKLIQQPRMASA